MSEVDSSTESVRVIGSEWSRRSGGRVGLALFACVVVFLMATAGGTLGQSTPGPAVCTCACYGTCGGGGCPTGSSLGIEASTQPTATNVTLSWHPTTEYLYGAWANVTFGNTTAYPFYAANDSGGYADDGSSIYLNYLEPSTTYYYKIVAWGYCISSPYSFYHQTYTAQFTTSAEVVSSGSQIYLDGTVLNTTGSPGSGGQLVLAHCSDWLGGWQNQTWGGSGSGDWAMYTHTGSNGAFQLPMGVLSGNSYVNLCDQAGASTVISILADGQTVCDFYDQCAYSTSWGGLGVWNETLVVWDRPYVDTELPTNFLSDPVLQVADFSNANASNGFPDAHLGYREAVTYSVSTSTCSVILGFIHYQCTTSSYTSLALSDYSVTGSNLIVTQRYWISGTVVLDAFTRGTNITSVSYFRTNGAPVLEGPSYYVPYTIGPSTPGAYPLYDWGGSGSGEGISVYAGAPMNGSVTINATDYDNYTNNYELTPEVPVGTIIAILSDGALDFDWDVPVPFYSHSFTERALGSYSLALNWTLYGDSSTVPTCYAVYGVGGSTSASSTTADAIGVWAFTPTVVGGYYSCPLR